MLLSFEISLAISNLDIIANYFAIFRQVFFKLRGE
jgi:hypothetical protein